MNKLTKERFVSAGVPEAEAIKIVNAGIAEREVGHLLIRAESGEHLVLAYDADVPLVVEGGRVLALDGTRRLVNSSVLAFLNLLDRYGRYLEDVVAATSDEEGERIARDAAEEMRRMDPPAFDNDAYYWPIVCAQMIEGNL